MKIFFSTWPICFACGVVALPSFAFAQVVIDEVMYNPQGSDSGREWVELHNEGQTDVTMVGGSGKGSWRISDSSNHTLTDPSGGTGRGSLTVPAGGYLIIANDPNEFISGEYAGDASSTYSVVKSSIALSNTGATVTLLDGSGATVDTVSYSPSQGGSDDGSSLQKQSDGSWIAALPTPGAANSSTPYVAPANAVATTTSTTASSSGAALQAPYIPPPGPSLYADAGGNRTVIVGADVEFDASAYDRTQKSLDPGTVRFLWNFGDGSIAEGEAVLHHFSYPDRYAVVLEIAQNKSAAADQIIVTAAPAELSLSLLPDGGIDIANRDGRDLDLSDWIVRESADLFSPQFMVPKDSKILAGSSMRIPPQTLAFKASSSTFLEYPNSVFALGMGGNPATTSDTILPHSVASATVAPPLPPQALRSPKVRSSQNTTSDPLPDPIAPPAQIDAIAPEAQTASAAGSPVSKYLCWVGVGALILAAGAAAVSAARVSKGEWDIIEQSEN